MPTPVTPTLKEFLKSVEMSLHGLSEASGVKFPALLKIAKDGRALYSETMYLSQALGIEIDQMWLILEETNRRTLELDKKYKLESNWVQWRAKRKGAQNAGTDRDGGNQAISGKQAGTDGETQPPREAETEKPVLSQTDVGEPGGVV
jgi:hypothetical protein